MNPIILGGILKQFYDKFSMFKFSDRLKLQKIIYLFQSKGFNLGYSFNLYLYGPYCNELTKDGYQIEQIKSFEEIEKLTFSGQEGKDFEEFIVKLNLNDRKNDLEWLEITSSYLILKKSLSQGTDEEIIERIKIKRPDFEISNEKIKEVIKEVNDEGYFK